mgnify:CR=1 FL=1
MHTRNRCSNAIACECANVWNYSISISEPTKHKAITANDIPIITPILPPPINIETAAFSFPLTENFSSGKNFNSALAMINRFGTIFLALVPGMSVSTIAMTRNLSQLHVPRSVTLGMLITMSFLPVLSAEIKRVREAMKTRGVGSIFNVKIFYRAFLIPLVCRLVDISDVLALSIETRGFMLGKANYTIYKREQKYKHP